MARSRKMHIEPEGIGIEPDARIYILYHGLKLEVMHFGNGVTLPRPASDYFEPHFPKVRIEDE